MLYHVSLLPTYFTPSSFSLLILYPILPFFASLFHWKPPVFFYFCFFFSFSVPVSLFFVWLYTVVWTSHVAKVVKNPPANAGDEREVGSIPGWGRFCGGRNGNPLQYSCLEKPMDREAWRATVHGVTKSQSRLNTHSSLFSVLDSTCKWYHTVFVFFCLTSLSIMFFWYIHVAANGRVSSFLWLSNIPLCVCVCLLCACVCTPCLFYPSIDGHLGCWHILAF